MCVYVCLGLAQCSETGPSQQGESGDKVKHGCEQSEPRLKPRTDNPNKEIRPPLCDGPVQNEIKTCLIMFLHCNQNKNEGQKKFWNRRCLNVDQVSLLALNATTCLSAADTVHTFCTCWWWAEETNLPLCCCCSVHMDKRGQEKLSHLFYMSDNRSHDDISSEGAQRQLA